MASDPDAAADETPLGAFIRRQRELQKLSMRQLAISKLAILQDFYSSLVAYKLPLPKVFLQSGAIVLPWLELFCGLMLMSGNQLPWI